MVNRKSGSISKRHCAKGVMHGVMKIDSIELTHVLGGKDNQEEV